MEETTQQIIQKPPFPIKTKIAAWWLIVVGEIMTSLGGAAFFFRKFNQLDPDTLVDFAIFIFFFIGLLILIPAWYLLKRKKWALSTLLITLFLIVFFAVWIIFPGFVLELGHGRSFKRLLTSTLPYFIPFIVPLVLLILDRKKFFKIAS